MGIFNNYMKPGKGVSKDEPEKKGFFLFWDILFHKLSKVIGTDCMYMLTSLLWIAVLMVIGIQFILPITPDKLLETVQSAGAENAQETAQTLLLSIYTMLGTVMFVLLGSGPVSASYSYIMKCFTNRQHAWIFSDGWDKFKENFKQAIAVVLIDAVVLILGFVAIKFYYYKFTGGSTLFGIPCYIIVVAMIIYTWMHFYIYQIMVTFKCTLKQLYKNALIFAMGKLPMNILLTITAVGVSVLPYFFIGNPFAALIITAVIGLALSRFPIEFYAARCMQKTIVAAEEKSASEQDEITAADDEPVFDDDLAKRINDKKDTVDRR